MIELLIQKPFGWVLETFYYFFNNYGIALILFSLAVKLILLPLSAKSKKSMMKQSRLQPKIKQIEIACGDDKQKYQQEVNALYKEEGVSLFGGCLWSLLPLLILIPLYNVIREPLNYLLHLSEGQIGDIKNLVAAAKNVAPKKLDSYWQYEAAQNIGRYVSIVGESVKSLDLTFLGIDLGQIPNWRIWNAKNWNELGGAIIPLVSGGLNYLSMFISQSMNKSVIRNEDGEKDEAAAATAAQTGKTMTMLMPLVSVVFGFIMPVGLSIYWIAQSVFGIIQDIFLTKHYTKVYDAEDEIKRRKAAERSAAEEEKERIRAAKRAANPDGILENTSKKKQQLREKQDREAAAKQFENQKRSRQGLDVAEEATNPGGEPNRPYARGRAYVANRYNKQGTSEE